MKCVFCGAVKNCAPFLQRVFKNIEQLGSLFDDYEIVVYCDRSNDNSYKLLKEYGKKNSRLTFYFNPIPVSKFRTHRIAHARNECIKMFYTKFHDYPYFIMMDFDDVCSKPVNIDVLKKYLQEDTWDALSFNKNPYYDTWALSIHPFVVSYRHVQNQENRTRYIQDILQNSNGLVSCMSAFNGFAIYRASKFVNCHYDGILRLDLFPQSYLNHVMNITRNRFKFKKPGEESSVLEDCEHRSFHLMAINKNKARIMIAPEILF
jgi:hypothetical protein